MQPYRCSRSTHSDVGHDFRAWVICVRLPTSLNFSRMIDFSSASHRMPPLLTSTSPMQMFSMRTLTIFYYSTHFLGLHQIWFSAYRLIPDARTSDLENAPISRRLRWTKTVQSMIRVWYLITMASSLFITWVLLPITKRNWHLYSELGFPLPSSR